MEWDNVVPLACAAYNFLPNEHSKESPFFLMFGREDRIPLNTMFQSQIRYLGNDENILSIQAFKNIYLQLWNGMMLYLWLVQHIISYLMDILKKVHFSLCLAEKLEFL